MNTIIYEIYLETLKHSGVFKKFDGKIYIHYPTDNGISIPIERDDVIYQFLDKYLQEK